MPTKDWNPGDRLAWAGNSALTFVFKGFGHFGSVIATLEHPIPGRPRDVIARQKDFVLLT